MKKLMIAALLITGAATFAKAQNASSQHVMLVPDSATVYYDEGHHLISGKEFSDKVSAGHYTFSPEVKDGKLASMQLKKVSGSMQLGAILPDFTVTDINGKTFALSQLKGKTIVLNFWFTACAPCREEMPELNQLVKKYSSDKNVIFLAITRDNADMVKKFLQSTPFGYAIAAGQAQLVNTYGIAAYPTNVVISKDGSVAFMLTSYGPENIRRLDAAITATSKM